MIDNNERRYANLLNLYKHISSVGIIMKTPTSIIIHREDMRRARKTSHLQSRFDVKESSWPRDIFVLCK